MRAMNPTITNLIRNSISGNKESSLCSGPSIVFRISYVALFSDEPIKSVSLADKNMTKKIAKYDNRIHGRATYLLVYLSMLTFRCQVGFVTRQETQITSSPSSYRARGIQRIMGQLQYRHPDLKVRQVHYVLLFRCWLVGIRRRGDCH